MPVQIAEAEVSELKGKGVDVLSKHVIEGSAASSASNDPADQAEAKTKAEPKQEETQKPPRKDDGMQKRFNELTKARREAEAQAGAERSAREKAEAELRALREQAERDKPRPAAPKREDFDDHDAYVEALADFKVEQKLAERDAKASKETAERRERERAEREQQEVARNAEQAAKEIGDRFVAQQEEVRKKYADFDTVVNTDAVLLKPSLASAMLQSEIGAELQYHFAQHPEVVDKLNGLDQASMLKELGKIELSLTAKPAGDGAGDQPRGPDGKFVQANEVSSAVKPIEPVRASDEGSNNKDPERMSVDEHRMAAYRAKSR
jgi:hypothetical protein